MFCVILPVHGGPSLLISRFPERLGPLERWCSVDMDALGCPAYPPFQRQDAEVVIMANPDTPGYPPQDGERSLQKEAPDEPGSALPQSPSRYRSCPQAESRAADQACHDRRRGCPADGCEA